MGALDFFVKRHPENVQNCAPNRARRVHFFQKTANFPRNHGHIKANDISLLSEIIGFMFWP